MPQNPIVQYLHPCGAQEPVRTPFGPFEVGKAVHIADPEVAIALTRNGCFHFVTGLDAGEVKKDPCACDPCAAVRLVADAPYLLACRCSDCQAARFAEKEARELKLATAAEAYVDAMVALYVDAASIVDASPGAPAPKARKTKTPDSSPPASAPADTTETSA